MTEISQLDGYLCFVLCFKMKKFIKSYCNSKWRGFSSQVKARDGYKCLKCHRLESETTLQVHHKSYTPKLLHWDYELSDCITLCKGCHAREHNKIEPDTDWTLISVDDLGSLDGICERKGCGAELRYENLIYHPSWGYKTVGSTCVEYLTREDKILSTEVLKIYKRISDFAHKTRWDGGVTQKGKDYIYTKYKYHQVRIYGSENHFSFQIILKQKEQRQYDYREVIKVVDKNLLQTKELAFIVLMGKTSESEKAKDILRNIYKMTR